MDNTQLSLVVANIAVSCGVHYIGTINVVIVVTGSRPGRGAHHTLLLWLPT